MWYPRLWLVVKPSVGLPLFFGGVAITSLIVHAAVLTHTSWYPAYLNGNQHTKGAAAVAASAEGGGTQSPTPSVVINVAPSAAPSK